jgi:hypothetical protein
MNGEDTSLHGDIATEDGESERGDGGSGRRREDSPSFDWKKECRDSTWFRFVVVED